MDLPHHDHEYLYCALPPGVSQEPRVDPAATSDPDAPPGGALILQKTNKWTPGAVLTWTFLNKPPFEDDEAIIVRAFSTWATICNIKFKRVAPSESPMIRILFKTGGSWSYVGRDILGVPADQPTMQFGWDLSRQPVTATHEIGHTLGFPHEHQNPNAGIQWNADAVYAEMASTQNPPWSKAQTDSNIMDKLTGVTGSRWDPKSVMHYGFKASLIAGPPPYNTQGIPFPTKPSKLDEQMARIFYPFSENELLAAPEAGSRHLGHFNWNDTVLEVTREAVLWDNTVYKLFWVNDLAFYHAQGSNWWYYIWNGHGYHCVKYKGGGFKEINPIN